MNMAGIFSLAVIAVAVLTGSGPPSPSAPAPFLFMSTDDIAEGWGLIAPVSNTLTNVRTTALSGQARRAPPPTHTHHSPPAFSPASHVAIGTLRGLIGALGVRIPCRLSFSLA